MDSEYNSISAATKAIFFFGTPHQGSSKANYADVLANVAAVMSYKPKSRVTTALKTNNEYLFNLTNQFKFRLSALQIVTFYEMKPTKPFKTLVRLNSKYPDDR
jgi:protein SERAC1